MSEAVLPGVEVAARPDAVWVRSESALGVLASAVVGGEFDAARHILNMHVPKGYAGLDPAGDLARFARGLGIAEPFVGLMTAAWTHRARTVVDEAGGVRVAVVATVGLSVPAAAGISRPAAGAPSTINLVVLLDARLERGAAVNGVITATEAKAGALLAGGLLTAEGAPATGTATDAVVIAWTGRGPRCPYLGPATAAGWCLARAVRCAVAGGAPA
jgi:adenosylcobinamide amidohydrolase